MAKKKKPKLAGSQTQPDLDWKLPPELEDWKLPELDWKIPELEDWTLPDLDWTLPDAQQDGKE